MAKEAAKTQSKNADQLIPPNSSQKILANIPVSTQELRNRVLKKVDFITSFLLSFFFLIQNS